MVAAIASDGLCYAVIVMLPKNARAFLDACRSNRYCSPGDIETVRGFPAF
jgi:hypothetical protein